MIPGLEQPFSLTTALRAAVTGPDSFLFGRAELFVGRLSSPTRDQIQAPCSRRAESEPLDQQGSPSLIEAPLLRPPDWQQARSRPPGGGVRLFPQGRGGRSCAFTVDRGLALNRNSEQVRRKDVE